MKIINLEKYGVQYSEAGSFKSYLTVWFIENIETKELGQTVALVVSDSEDDLQKQMQKIIDDALVGFRVHSVKWMHLSKMFADLRSEGLASDVLEMFERNVDKGKSKK